MNTLVLHRHLDYRDGAPGILTVLGEDVRPHQFCTMERHYRGNVRFESSVPAGRYDLEWHGSVKYPTSWALVGGTVQHYPPVTRGAVRFAILIHRANWAHQLNGCIALGEKFFVFPDRGRDMVPRLGVSHSGRALWKLKTLIGTGEGWQLVIKPPPPGVLA